MRQYLAALVIALPLVVLAQVPGYGASNAPAEGGNSQPSAQGQLFLQLQQLQDEVAVLRGNLEEQQNQIQRLQQESLERYQELDKRLTDASAGAAAGAAASQSAASTASATNAAASPPGGQQAGDPDKEKLYYDAAFDLIRQKDFDKASKAFSVFLKRYPQSQYAGNAQYWLGEVDLTKGDLDGASDAFAKVGQNYPSHNKVPDSLYKLATVERRQGDTDKARDLLQQVVSRYPGSSAAKLAQSDLQRNR